MPAVHLRNLRFFLFRSRSDRISTAADLESYLSVETTFATARLTPPTTNSKAAANETNRTTPTRLAETTGIAKTTGATTTGSRGPAPRTAKTGTEKTVTAATVATTTTATTTATTTTSAN